MSRKNANARAVARKPSRSAAVTETGSATRTAAEGKLWEALRANSGSTTAELATQAGIGKSTAGKILAVWNGEGKVDRASGAQNGGRRSADRWAVAAAETPAADAQPTTRAADVTPPPTEERDVALSGGGPAESSADDETSPTTTITDSAATATKAARLGKGALRGMVEDHLRAHPDEQFSPNAIGKALDRSAGAVNNALEKLVADGYAVRTQDKPKRFSIKPD